MAKGGILLMAEIGILYLTIYTGIDAVIFGHSHKYFEQAIDGRLWLNPGSCGKRRFDQEITLAMLTVDGSTLSAKKIVIQP